MAKTESSHNVLVTGAGSGIGLAVASRFASTGAKVGLFDLNSDAVEAAEASIGAERTCAIPGSVTSEDDVERAVATMNDRFGGVNCVVASAGIVNVEPALEVSLERYQRTMDVNVMGSWVVAQKSAQVMTKAGGGSILFIGSVYGDGGAPNRTAYCASKGAIHNLTRSLAVEWGPLGIRVNAVAPTGVRTPMVQELIDAGTYNMAGVKGRTPLGRLAEPEEVADACVFLASEKAGMITGAILPVDGGWLANGYTTVG